MCAFKEKGYLVKGYFFVELLVISRVFKTFLFIFKHWLDPQLLFAFKLEEIVSLTKIRRKLIAFTNLCC